MFNPPGDLTGHEAESLSTTQTYSFASVHKVNVFFGLAHSTRLPEQPSCITRSSYWGLSRGEVNPALRPYRRGFLCCGVNRPNCKLGIRAIGRTREAHRVPCRLPLYWSYWNEWCNRVDDVNGVDDSNNLTVNQVYTLLYPVNQLSQVRYLPSENNYTVKGVVGM